VAKKTTHPPPPRVDYDAVAKVEAAMGAAGARLDRWLTRLKRAAGEVEKSRQQLKRLGRRLAKLMQPAPAGKEPP
jgi:hypothetical protein